MIARQQLTHLREQRRKVLMANPHLKGLDSVRVAAVAASPVEGVLWTLHLLFVPAGARSDKPPRPERLGPRQVRILLNGHPDPSYEVKRVSPGADPEVLVVQVLSVGPESHGQDPPGHVLELTGADDLDPFFSSAPVTFRLKEPAARLVPLEYREKVEKSATEIDYLARDFDSFRQLLLERMAFYVPDWRERNPSDLGVTVVEVLAYAADYLSYYQDAVATEAYLDTARRRISVRRHTRLLGFPLHEGSNARAWVQIQLQGEEDHAFRLPAGSRILTASARLGGTVAEESDDFRRALDQGALVFQTLYDVTLVPAHEELRIYTWGAEDYILPRLSTTAALRGHFPHLRAGDVLVIERREGVDLAGGATPDPRQRQAVRLAHPPRQAYDPLTGQEITEIDWHEADALEKDYPVSRTSGGARRELLSLMHGNVVLADHGLFYEDLLERVPESGPYYPMLPRSELTFRQPFDAAQAAGEPAAWAIEQDEGQALPDIELYELPVYSPDGAPLPATAPERSGLPVWRPRQDLLGSSRFARDFVAEIDARGRAHLRFGDGQAGRRPAAGARFLARYRIGNGPHGNVGAHALQHLVLPERTLLELAAGGMTVLGVRNHLAGQGGTRSKPTESAQVYAPESVHDRSLHRRCVTEEDFAATAERHPEVRRAVARLHWNGSATVARLYIQRRAGIRSDPLFERRLAKFLRPYLMAGFELVLSEPHYVPLDIEITVTTQPGVREETLYRTFFGRREREAGGLFSPDDFSFGRSLFLSRVTARIMSIPGVADVRVDRFQRWGQPAAGELENGEIPIGPLEILRIDNNPAAPQLGSLRVRVEERR